MFRSIIILVFGGLVTILFNNTVNAQSLSWTTQNSSNCSDQYGSFDAFIPGIRGHGACTRGGFVPGTTVISVTNLGTSGTGSFKAAMDAGCPKVIIFDVAGHVDFGIAEGPYNGGSQVGCDHVSIVGASAPGQFAITAGDLSSGLRLGGGDLTMDNIIVTSHGRGSNTDDRSQSRDVVNTGWLQGGKSNKLLFNNAFIWGWDEGIQCYDRDAEELSNGFTLWQNIIGLSGGHEPGSNPKTSHQYAQMNHFNCLQTTMIRNVYLHDRGRTPFTRGDGLLHANNITFNAGIQNLVSQPCDSGAALPNYRVNVINNLSLRGPNTTHSIQSTFQFQQADCKTGTVSIYENGNAVQNALTQEISNCSDHRCALLSSGNNWANSPIPYAMANGYVPETFDPTIDAELTAFANKILKHVGPRPADRIPYIQSRVIDQIMAGLAGNTDGMGAPLKLGQTTMNDEGGFAAITDTGSWDASAQCGGMPTGAAADVIQPSGLTGLHEWVIGCFYDEVMPTGYREDGIASFPVPEGDEPVVAPNPPEIF